MKTKWYDLAKQLMRAQGMSQDSLADHMGITKGGLSHWLNGRREPNLEDIARIMRALGRRQFTVTHDGMVIDDSLSNTLPGAPPLDVGRYPVIDWKDAGNYMEEAKRASLPHVNTSVICSDDSYWLVAKGESMNAPQGLSIPAGTMILVDPHAPAIDGKLVIAQLEEGQTPTFKQLIIDGGQRLLRSLNPLYPPIPLNPESKIIGVVVDAKIVNLP
ncbi:TPA: helix-turn-helix domain-containing protein [Escherichia coli]|nr:helix-turn-helix domain-containing protein [Escherichia coli]